MLPWEGLAPRFTVLPQGMARCGALLFPVGPLRMRLRQRWGWVANEVSRTCVFPFKRDSSVSRLLLMGQVQAPFGRDTVNSFCLQIWRLVPSLTRSLIMWPWESRLTFLRPHCFISNFVGIIHFHYFMTILIHLINMCSIHTKWHGNL